MSSERPNLAGAFEPKRPTPNRAAGLTGLLPHPRPSVEAPAFVADHSSDPVRPATRRTAAAPSAQPRAQPVETDTEHVGEGPVSNVAVYLEPDVRHALQAARRSSGASYDELVVDAFAAVSDEDLRAQFRPIRTTPASGGMPKRQRRIRGTAGIQLQLRLDSQQRAWLDQKRELVGAPSRSALVAVCLRLQYELN